ncbi:MAG: HEAT repeat domain-containing protein, partial [Acidobacteriota bacterium]|nr:HEAT repeat domain-containing protein [Acidobacteriota bacterium]
MIAEFHYFRPQETHPEDLNRILVARDDFLDEYLQGLTQSDEANPFQHYLLIGPRGIGKSTLLEVVRYRIEHDPILNRRWEVILLPEENYRITTLADLWLEVLDALAEKHGDRAIAEAYERLRFADNDTTCSESLEMIRSLHEQKGFSLLLLLENLDRLLDKRLPADDIKLWRKTLTEEPWLLTLCSSCTYPAGITNPKKPFLDFFNTYPLEELTLAQQETMLRNLAELRGEGAFEEKLQQFQSRLHALHYFTGGNPRLTVVLYELIVNYNVADTTAELKKLLDRMTPLYQERMNDLPAQEAKLLESLALLPEGESPKELGALARVSEGSVRKLLSRLEEAGYVQRRDTGGRKNAYIIPERFFRIWLRMSRSRAARGQIFYLFEFFKNWYATEQERDAVYTELLDEFREGYEDDRRRENAEAYLSYIEAVSEGDEHYRRVFMRLSETLDYLDDAEILNELEALDRDYRSDVDYWNEKGLFLQIALCRLEEAMQAFKKAEYIDPDNEDTPFLLLDCARVLGDWQAVKRYKKRLEPLFDQDSVGSDETKAERLVRSLLAYENKHWARQAFRQLDSRIDDFLIGELIDSDKNASDSWFRRKLNGLIGRTGKVKYQNYLLDQLQDPDSAVRGSAATALGRIGDPGVVPTLIHVLDSSVEPDSTVRGSAASALGRIGDPKAVPVLIQALDPKAEPDPITRGSAASALGRIGVPKAVPALIQALDAKAEPGSEVRGSAASALGRVRKPKAVPALIQTLDPKAEPDPITRGSAASALGHIGDPRAVPA